MPGVAYISHEGVEILYIDFSHTDSRDEVVQIIEEARRLIAGRPHMSVFTLTNITSAYFDRDISQELKGLASHNKPYVRAGAVIGLTTTRKIIYHAVLFFSKRKLEICEDIDSAKAWLVAQAKQELSPEMVD